MADENKITRLDDSKSVSVPTGNNLQTNSASVKYSDFPKHFITFLVIIVITVFRLNGLEFR